MTNSIDTVKRYEPDMDLPYANMFEKTDGDYVSYADYATQAARIEQLTASLTRMLEMHDLIMEKVNFGASFFDTECLMEMNAAPVQARSLLGEVQL